MGWSDCGWNSDLQVHMGYGHSGVCMHDGCKEEIDHGLAYVCGGMHEGGDYGCGRYMCEAHLYILPHYGQLCERCAEEAERAEAIKARDN